MPSRLVRRLSLTTQDCLLDLLPGSVGCHAAGCCCCYQSLMLMPMLKLAAASRCHEPVYDAELSGLALETKGVRH